MEFKIKNLIKKVNKLTKILPKFQRFDQILSQNTSLDHTTADIAKQQTKSSLKAIYESKMEFKIRNLIKNVNKLKKIPPKKILAFDQILAQNSSSEHQPGPYNCRYI
jgi:hypothetical protein